MKYFKYLKDVVNESVNDTTCKWYLKSVASDMINNGINITNKFFTKINNTHVLTVNITPENYSLNDSISSLQNNTKPIIKVVSNWKKKLFNQHVLLSVNIIPKEYSIQAELILKNIFIERVNPPRYVYHISKKRNAIAESGLIPKECGGKWSAYMEYPPAIFAATGSDPQTWFSYDEDKYVWRIDTKQIKNKWWTDFNVPKSFGWVMTFDPIPTSALYLMTKEEIEALKVPDNI